MSGGLNKVAQTAKSTFTKVQGQVDKVTTRNKLLGMSFNELERKIRQTEAAIRSSNIPSQIRAARSELERLQRVQARHIGGDRSSSSGGGWGRSLIAGIGVAGAMALGGNVMTAGLDAQARQASFEVMAGKDAGAALNKDLTKYAQDSIYGKEVYGNAQTMMGFGIDSKDVMGNTRMLGDVAMGNAQKLESLTLAFSQVSAAGKLTGQDLLQFVNAGFNPLGEISDKTGIKIGDLRKQMEKGAITSEMVKAAFQSATGEGGRFYQMTERIAQTDFGKWQAFKGQLDGLAMSVGGMLAPAFGDLITNYLQPFVTWLGEAAVWLQQNWNWIGLIVTVLGTLAVVIGVVSAATAIWAKVTLLLNTIMAMNPIVLVVAAIAALIAGIIYAYNKFAWFRGAIQATWAVIKGFGNMLKEFVIDRIAGIISGLGGLASAIVKLFKGDFSGAWDTAKQAGKDLLGLDAAKNAVNNFKQIGKDAATAYNTGVAEIALKKDGKKVNNVKDGTATPSTANVSDAFRGLKAGTATGSGSGDTVKGITSSGPRTININGVKFADKIEVHASSVDKGLDNLEEKLQEYFLRLLNSGAAVQ